MVSDPPGRDFFDPVKLRENVLNNAKEAFGEKLNGLESNNFILKVKDLHYKNPEKTFSLADQKSAILERRDITVPLRGTFSLIDKRTDQEVANKTTVVAHIPYITDRNTSIYNGNEYSSLTQQRLLPGVYTRVKETGEAEGHLVVQSGSGTGGRLLFDPARELFVYMIANTKIPLYGLLKDLGVGDSSMQESWGKEIFAKNRATYTGNEIEKFWDKVFNRQYS